MAHITLIRPALASTPRTYSVIIAPPLGLAYIAAALRSAGHQLAVIDAQGEAPETVGPAGYPGMVAHGLSNEAIVERIPERTQGIGISVMFTQQWPHVEALTRLIHSRFPQVPIFLGGEHPTATWSYLLSHCPEITACILGEGELAAVDIASWIDGKQPIDEIPGIAVRKDGVGRKNDHRPRVTQMGSLPWPAWDLFPMEQYLVRGLGHGVNRGRSIPMLATRGCPYQCTFCSSPSMWGTRYVVRRPEDVADEIESYIQHYAATNIDFEDLTAFMTRDWTLALCREIERRGLRITYQLPSGTRSEVLDREVLEALYRTGCRNLTYAPESGSPSTLDRIKKRVHLNRMLDSMRAAVEAGIVVRVNMIVGFPFETRRDIWETILFCFRMAWIGVEDIPLFPFTPYPGSALYDELRAQKLLPDMSNEFFASLQVWDLTYVCDVSRNVNRVELALYRALGMSLFLIVGYVTHPRRILRTLRNWALGRSESAIEQRLNDLFLRPLYRALRRLNLAGRYERPNARSAQSS